MDKYDRAIKYFTENPEQIMLCWMFPKTNTHSCLFQHCGDRNDTDIGCLTMIRNGTHSAATDKLTDAIAGDERIPLNVEGIAVETLPIFAEWQRKIDLELGR